MRRTSSPTRCPEPTESHATGALEFDEARGVVEQLVDRVSDVYRGPAPGRDLAIGCLLARGHLLLDDVPGVGKTTLARTLAHALGIAFKRIQFTSDLLPGDVTGSHIYNPQTADFVFRRGPVFTQVLLADEINRASPRTQSSLLECMEEQAVTIDGTRFELEPPFWVIATQNPVETQGTFLLPRSQLDRFLVRTRLGYPDTESELRILAEDGAGARARVDPILDAARTIRLQASVDEVHASEELRRYLISLIQATREHPRLLLGAGPRASLALLRMSRAWAMMRGRSHVIPDDLKAVAHPVLAHRLVETEGEISPVREQTLREVLETVPSPV